MTEDSGLSDPNLSGDIIRGQPVRANPVGKAKQGLDYFRLSVLGGFATQHGYLLYVSRY